MAVTYTIQGGSVTSSVGKTRMRVTFTANDGRTSTQYYESDSIDEIDVHNDLVEAAQEFNRRTAVSVSPPPLTMGAPVVATRRGRG